MKQPRVPTMFPQRTTAKGTAFQAEAAMVGVTTAGQKTCGYEKSTFQVVHAIAFFGHTSYHYTLVA